MEIAKHNGAPLVVDPVVLRTDLAAANVTVLTSSNSKEDSLEGQKWGGHGAFTKALLDVLSDPAADVDHNRLIICRCSPITSLSVCRR